jgi:4-coumarate--CoA ligase
MKEAYHLTILQVRRLLCLPQFHAFAAPRSHLAPLREGHKTYIMRRYHPDSYLRYLAQYQITETALANPIVMHLLSIPDNDRKLLSSLRFVWIAGAPLEASVQNQLSRILHEQAIVCQCWGMTEAGWITTRHYPEKDDTGSVGRLLPNVEARYIFPF